MAFPSSDRFTGDPLPPHPLAARRGGRGKYWALLALVVALGAGWSGLWFYAAAKTEDAVAGWRLREAEAGRVHSCASESFGGYPFRIELTCAQAESELRGFSPPLHLKATDILAAAQIYQPNLLIAEIEGPVTVAEAGQPPLIAANWTLAQVSLRGTPSAPERVSIAIDSPTFSHLDGGVSALMAKASRMELHGRIASGTVADNPVVEAVMRLAGASLPGVHALAAAPVDADVTARLRGLKDFAPKPWAARFREIQAADGSIEITNARVAQGDTVAVGSGTLRLNAAGKLEGQMRLTIAGLEPFLKAIGIERSAPVDRLAGTLDRFIPGLGAAARAQAGAGVIAGMNLIGEQAVLEGRAAVTVPLRFTDGAMYLGPIQLGQAPALF